MKKLMIALTAAAAAFALQADVSSIAAEDFNAWTSVEEQPGWTDLGESSLSETEYTYGQKNVAGLPDAKSGSLPGKNLAIKTAFSAPAYYSITEQSMEGVYFDSLVKFTACDEDATIPADSDAKIMVWTKEIVNANDVVQSTNLMVTAGYFSDDQGGISPKIYDCGSITGYNVIPDGNDWCRLTIKTYTNITTTTDMVPAFRVFVNATPVAIEVGNTNHLIGVTGSYADQLNNQAAQMEESHWIFPSIVEGGEHTISAVGFAGQGAIDDVSFVTSAPTTDGEKSFVDDPAVLVAKVGETSCADVGEINTAIAAATAGATVSLLDNVTGDLTFGVAQPFTLNLGGKTLTGAITQSGGSLVINGEGKVTGNVTVRTGATNTINGAVFDGTVTVQSGRGDSGVLTINGGLFSISGGNTVDALNKYVKTDYELKDNGEGYLAVVEVSENGTAAKPWLIGSAADFANKVIEKGVGDKGAGVYFKQTADIALSGEWTGIGAFDAKDNVSWALSGDKAITAEAATTKTNAYIQGAFQGNFDGGNFTISGLVLQRGDYVGFFGSTYGATIKNVKISLGNATGFGAAESGTTGSESGASYGGAAIVGVSADTTIENCQTLVAGEYAGMTATKGLAGIVGYASSGTVIKGCVNNLSISTANEKAGGFVACAQNGNPWMGSNGVTIDGCTNNGNITCTTSGKTRVGGLVSYADSTVTFKGANVVDCTLTQDGGVGYSLASPNGGSITVADGATFTVPAAYKTAYSGKAVDGLFFATVADGVATLVKNAALVAGGSYKVMAAGAAPTIELAAEASISFDTSLVALGSVTGITTVENYEVKSSTDGNVTTYTSTASGTPVTSVTLDITATNVLEGATFTLTATVLPADATVKTVTWTTSDKAIATVADGVVMAVTATNTAVTITATAGDKSATCKVTVSAKPTLGDNEGTIETGNDGKATVKPATGVTEVEVKGISGAVTEVSVPKSVEKVIGVDRDKVRVTYTAADAGAKTYDITSAFTKNGDASQGVTFELKPDGSVEVDGETVPVTPTAIEADASEGTVADGAVATKAIPGLTYTLKRQTSLAAGAPGAEKVTAASATAVSGSVSLKDGIVGEKPSAAFYTIEVTK